MPSIIIATITMTITTAEVGADAGRRSTNRRRIGPLRRTPRRRPSTRACSSRRVPSLARWAARRLPTCAARMRPRRVGCLAFSRRESRTARSARTIASPRRAPGTRRRTILRSRRRPICGARPGQSCWMSTAPRLRDRVRGQAVTARAPRRVRTARAGRTPALTPLERRAARSAPTPRGAAAARSFTAMPRRGSSASNGSES